MIFFFRALLITRGYAGKLEDGSAGTVSGLVLYPGYLIQDTGEGPAVRRAKLVTLAGMFYNDWHRPLVDLVDGQAGF